MRRTYNLSLLRLGTTLWGRDTSTGTRRLRIRVPEFGAKLTWPEDGLAFETLLQDLERPTMAWVHEDEFSSSEGEVTALLPRGFWPHDADARTSIVSHVDPTDPVLGTFWWGPSGVPELRAVFERCAAAFEPRYRTPSKIRTQNGATAQRVPDPTEIVANQEGTCLDLSLLMAALYEANGGAPLLVFSGGPEESPDHALIAEWVGIPPSLHPGSSTPPPGDESSGESTAESVGLIGSDRLRAWVRDGRLRVLESTELAAGKSRAAERAEELGRSFVERVACHAVDVNAVRRATAGRAVPGGLLYAPLVARVDLLATRMAVEERIGQRESRHILQALAELGSPVLGTLLGESGLQALKRRGAPARPGEPVSRLSVRTTQGYHTVFIEARVLASARPDRKVTEEDLLCALLRRPRPAIRSLLESAGTNPGSLANTLSPYTPRPLRGGGGGWDTTHG
ncbi:MAG: hypothetical protein KDA27_13015 [Candidatus Eisenbacteria bacterium]|uniref:Uncharacterized protein n=1 Tax=Eiseniibacteriota bacterium TaxID=2212470 RepID=A0A956ND27_UNCEI|nr:hypothetical protein [Candidatus Eisenbacteria bacterium]MCB9465861.1 hypothetical protein [Candidatus Eisenbacteria bacterium]